MAGHTHGPTSGTKFWIALAATLTFTVVEASAGFFAHSLALMSDAGHNFTDALALGLAAYAIWIGKRPASSTNTYGYHRVAIITALFNATTLVGISLVIGIEGYQRFFHPVVVHGLSMIFVAGGGLILNGSIAIGLASEAKHSMNARAAFVHMAGDAISSIGVVVAGLLVLFFHWTVSDAIVSLLIAVIILFSGVGIIRESIAVLMESVPKNINVDSLVTAIRSVKPVCDVHDLHIWQIGDGMNFLSCHVTLPITCSLEDSTTIIQQINDRLHDDFHIGHATIQSEPVGLCKIEVDDHLYCALTVHDHDHDHHH